MKLWWLVVGSVVVTHLFASPMGEPWKNNDETRHVMTGVFFADAIHDLPSFARNPKAFATDYYTQYPALGLLVWPPFFYGVEGVGMAILGPDFWVARLVLSLFNLIAAWYVFALARRFVSEPWAGFTVALVGFAPLVFQMSRYVLLEMPTLAMVLASIYHFEKCLESYSFRQAMLACVFAALAALTRFDGVLLLPFVAIRILQTREWRVLTRRGVIIGVLTAIVLTGPNYALTMREYSKGLVTATTTGTNSDSTSFLALANFTRYPEFVPEQIGSIGTFATIMGAIIAVATKHSARGFLLALIAAVYVTFTPMAEQESRHAIYWIPALALLTVIGLEWLGRKCSLTLAVTLAAGILGWTAYLSTEERGWYVRGYEEAAKYVLENREADRPVLMEGVLNGGFIYQIRRLDTTRRVQVLRGDKLFYAVLSNPAGGYEEFTKSDTEALAKLHDYDPEFIVIESAPLFDLDLPASRRFHELLKKHPDKFRFEKRIDFDSNHDAFKTFGLEIYRKVDRNPQHRPLTSIPVLGLGRDVGK
ncbi:MAG: ArnT family glycosyltransferase [Fimbriiglobus sp.]